MDDVRPPNEKPSAKNLPGAPLHHDLYPSIDYEQGELKGSLPGYKVLITGASQGCGQAMAVAFALAGAVEVYLTATKASNLKSTEEQVKKAVPQAKVHSYGLDVSSEQQVEDVIGQILKTAGKLDCVINNAGRLEQWAPFAESNVTDWWSTWEVNVKGLYLVSRLVIQHMVKQGGGTVIQISSTGSLSTGRGASSYQTTKLVVNRLAEFIHVDHRQQGIRVFALHPGAVPTTLAHQMPARMHVVLKDSPKISAGMAVYLCQPKADFLRGRYVSANCDVAFTEAHQQEIIDKDLLKVKLIVE